MSKGRLSAFSQRAAFLALAFSAHAQSVISTHSGIIHYFEGDVTLDGQPIESRLGKYSAMPQGSELRTVNGHAEVLLTPGVFLRMGDHTAIRMVANDLGDTKVELTDGRFIVDAGEPNADTSVTLIYKQWRVHLLQKGVYRLDSEPAKLCVREGKAEAFAAPAGSPVAVEARESLPFAAVLVTDKMSREPLDDLTDWSRGRGQSITADNAITAQIDEDPSSQTVAADGFTYYPMLGLLAPSPGLSNPGLSNPYLGYTTQPGFNSIYLPGYTYLPFLLGPYGGGIHSYLTSPLRRIVVTPASSVRAPGTGFVGYPISPGRPIGPAIPRPVSPLPIHPAPHIGVHK